MTGGIGLESTPLVLKRNRNRFQVAGIELKSGVKKATRCGMFSVSQMFVDTFSMLIKQIRMSQKYTALMHMCTHDNSGGGSGGAAGARRPPIFQGGGANISFCPPKLLSTKYHNTSILRHEHMPVWLSTFLS